jgi:hypothetical protein
MRNQFLTPNPNPIRAILKPIIDLIDDIIVAQHPQSQLHVIWVPGHHGVEGNERADTEAKRAAPDPSLRPPFNYRPPEIITITAY